jgi:glycosyltransferase involved in cell wall biosynthesis
MVGADPHPGPEDTVNSLTRPLHIVNNAEIAEAHWRFLEGKTQGTAANWDFHRAHPQNWLERLVRRPKLARLRAAWCAALAARRADVLITHLPRTTLWTALMCGLLFSRPRHLAFSFNFTHLPGRATRLLMRLAFRRVDRFVVFSRVERDIYADVFGIDPARIDFLPWAMDVPRSNAPLPQQLPARYACAVGGEGRDYRTLMEAARRIPDVALVVVARPHSLIGLDIPSNVIALSNVEGEVFWAIVAGSAFTVVPLLTQDTACGHISIVGSLLLDRPVIATRSSGIADYVADGENALMVPAGDAALLAERIRRFWDDPVHCELMGRHAGDAARARHNERVWSDYLSAYFDDSQIHR